MSWSWSLPKHQMKLACQIYWTMFGGWQSALCNPPPPLTSPRLAYLLLFVPSAFKSNVRFYIPFPNIDNFIINQPIKLLFQVRNWSMSPANLSFFLSFVAIDVVSIEIAHCKHEDRHGKWIILFEITRK